MDSRVAPENRIGQEQKIVVVGGGPAGIHMASLLAAKGFRDITVLEAEPKVGGKSFTIADPDEPGLVHEMGTCYLHALYDPVRELVRKYQGDGNREIQIGDGKGARVVFGSDRRQGDNNDFIHGTDFNDLVLEKAEEESCIPKFLWDLSPDFFQVPGLLWSILKYWRLHRKIFGAYSYGFPPRPEDWSAIDMTGRQFLEMHGLLNLDALFRYTQQIQGYGVLEDVHAFYLLWWMHPGLLFGIIRTYLGNKPGVTMLEKGYQSLWERVVEKDGLQVLTSAKVTSIIRDQQGEARHRVLYTRDGKSEEMECDVLFFTLGMDRFRGLFESLTELEERHFGSYTSTVLCTTLYEANPVSHEHAVEMWYSRMRPDPERDGEGVEGRFHMHRNSRLALTKELEAQGRQRRVAYQYMGRPFREGDPEKLERQLLEDLKLVGESGVKLIKQTPWPYFPQFTSEGLRSGYPWEILKNQGRGRTFFLGSSVCFESVLDCVVYNEIVNRGIRAVPL